MHLPYFGQDLDSKKKVLGRAGEMTSEVRGPGFRGPNVTHSKNGKVIGFDQTVFRKGPNLTK